MTLQELYETVNQGKYKYFEMISPAGESASICREKISKLRYKPHFYSDGSDWSYITFSLPDGMNWVIHPRHITESLEVTEESISFVCDGVRSAFYKTP